MNVKESQDRAIEVAKIRGMFPIITRVSYLSKCQFTDDETRQNTTAHAHDNLMANNFGVICLADDVKMFKNDGKPSATMLHEVAHLMVSEEYCNTIFGHGQEWQDFYNILRAEWGFPVLDNPTTRD